MKCPTCTAFLTFRFVTIRINNISFVCKMQILNSATIILSIFSSSLFSHQCLNLWKIIGLQFWKLFSLFWVKSNIQLYKA
jgi:hypothetical protein